MGPKDDRAHFEQLAMPALLQAMKRAFTRPPKDAAALARPFRILLSLSDRADVGGPIVQGVFVTVLESAQAHIESIPSLSNEVYVQRTAVVLKRSIRFGKRLQCSCAWQTLSRSGRSCVQTLPRHPCTMVISSPPRPSSVSSHFSCARSEPMTTRPSPSSFPKSQMPSSLESKVHFFPLPLWY